MMISHEFTAEYLNPVLWNNLNNVLAPVYARNGNTLHIYKNEDGRYTVSNSVTEDTYDRIMIYTKEGITDFYKRIEDMNYLNQSIDSYQIQIRNELNRGKGIDIIGRKEESSLFQFMETALPKEDCIFLLWIMEETGSPYFNCILKILNGRILLVSTSDRYEPEPVTYESCLENVRNEFAEPVISKEFTVTEWNTYVSEKSF